MIEEKIEQFTYERDGILFKNEEDYAMHFVASRQCPIRFIERHLLYRMEKMEKTQWGLTELINTAQMTEIIRGVISGVIASINVDMERLRQSFTERV